MPTTTSQEFVAEQLQLNKRRAILHPILRRLVPPLAKVDIEGLDRLPVSGPTLMMGNHVSLVDPILITATIQSRYVISMAKVETLDNPIQHWALKTWGNFVINRGEVDRTALNNTIALLKSEQLVWIAPEGTRNPDGLGEARGGVPFIAHKANAVIVPIAICGIQNWHKRLMSFKRAYAKIIFGKPFHFHIPTGERLSREVRDQMITEAMYQLALTMPDEFAYQRGVYSDIDKATTKYLKFI
ncbi:MAG: lysophospholipid acyltransferase family protein [Phototrophicaceae bacterium]